MRIPASPEEVKELEAKLAENDKAVDWITPIFPDVGLRVPEQTPVNNLLNEIGEKQLPPKP